jgi:sarcosine/dimethylglycine N-methyltransferase
MCNPTGTAVESERSTKNVDNTIDDDHTLSETPQSTMSDDIEREVWEFMTPMAWHISVADKASIFRPTYQATIDTLRKTAEEGGYDVILEVGCGTGDIIGEMNNQQTVRTSVSSANFKGQQQTSAASSNNAVTIPCIGVDINKEFIDFCKKLHPHEACEFVVADALKLEEWWKEAGHANKYRKPLVICVNNTLNIMPHELRGGVVDQMIAVAGAEGLCMVSYWNGNFFSHAVMNYYKKNAQLCGEFEVHKHVDWDKRILVTPTNYSTHWQTPSEVQALLRSYDVDVPTMVKNDDLSKTGTAHIRSEALAIFVWFDRNSTSKAKGYYDSDDAQTFYSKIWGDNELHVGRYDLLTEEDKSTLTKQEQINRAEEYHELALVDHIRTRCLSKNTHGLRVIDMGCGYGGLIRRLYKEGLVWKATGCDISHRMCAHARKRNAELLARDDGDESTLEILPESFLQISVGNESADVVISVDALLHVGPERQRRAVAEAARILRPGGWMIFSDIMQEEVLASEEDMQPIYDRINLSKMGTISNYKAALEECGFTNISTDLHSENISTHYGHVLEVTQDKGKSIGLSESYLTSAMAGLKVWKEKSPGNIVWGIIAAQKTHKVDLDNIVGSN